MLEELVILVEFLIMLPCKTFSERRTSVEFVILVEFRTFNECLIRLEWIVSLTFLQCIQSLLLFLSSSIIS